MTSEKNGAVGCTFLVSGGFTRRLIFFFFFFLENIYKLNFGSLKSICLINISEIKATGIIKLTSCHHK